jgi:hypothetical protein
MAMRMSTLMANIEPQLAQDAILMDDLPFIGRMRFGGSLLHSLHGSKAFSSGPRPGAPDVFRGWQAFAIESAALDVESAFAYAVPFAADKHFAVREWAWLAVRRLVIAEPDTAIRVALDVGRAHCSDPLVVRFAVEATRPRSVWGGHVQRFKEEPALGEQLLRLAFNRPERYPVSAALNWISDAAQTRPDWAQAFASTMTAEVESPWAMNRLRVLALPFCQGE